MTDTLRDMFERSAQKAIAEAMGIPASYFEASEPVSVTVSDVVQKMHALKLHLKARRMREYLDTYVVLLMRYEAWQVAVIMHWYDTLEPQSQESFATIGATWGLLERVILLGWGYKPKNSWLDLMHIVHLFMNKRMN